MKTKLISILLLFALCIPLLVSCSDSEQPGETTNEQESTPDTVSALELVKDGVSEYVIVRGENASPSEITAANELQSYLKQISGAELSIVTDTTPAAEKEIVVGKTNREAEGDFNRDEFGNDGFVIKTTGHTLWLVGGEQRGTLYSVYTFLEEYLGCRFYTAEIEKIPEASTITLDSIAENKQIPVFTYRDLDWVAVREETFMVKLKGNGSYAVISDAYGSNHTFAPGFCHTFAQLTGTDQYSQQPCLSDPAVIASVTEQVRQLLASNPKVTFIELSQNDNASYCTCDECNRIFEEEGSQAGVLLRFVNAIANEFAEEYPDVLFQTFAYQYTRQAPKVTKPASNVAVRLCSIECCFSHALDECVFDYGRADLGGGAPEPGTETEFVTDLKAWAAICDNLYIWDYVANFRNSLLYFPNFESMLKNMRLFADNGVDGVYPEGIYFGDTGDFPELRAYILSKLLWNPYMSEEEYWGHIDDFLQGVYGPGWENIRSYIDLAQALTRDNCVNIGGKHDELFPVGEVVEVNPVGTYPEDFTADTIRNYESVDWTQYWNYSAALAEESEYLVKGKEYFANALAMAETDAQKQIIEKTYLQVEYYESWYRLEKHNAGRLSVKNILVAYFEANPDEFTSSEQSAYRSKITKLARDQAEAALIEFNKALFEKLKALNISRIAEANVLDFVNGADSYNFAKAAGGWQF